MVSKYLLILVIVIAAIFIWRSHRKAAAKINQVQKEREQVLPMLPCRWCGVHFPKSEAVTGKRGTYCSLAHQRKAEP